MATRTHRHAAARHDSRRGSALLIAVMVLTALFLLGVPFAIFMRMQHTSATQALHKARAVSGEGGAHGHARAVLYQGWAEQARIDTGLPDLFPFDDPAVDTLWEFRATLRTRLAETPAGGWGDDLPDTPPAPPDDNVIWGPPVSEPLTQFVVDNALGFPTDGNDQTIDGYIRVDDEWMAYSHVDQLDTAPANDRFPMGRVSVRAEHRGLFGSAIAAHAPPAAVSFFPDEELWQLDLVDPQSRINLNTASFRVIYNLLDDLGVADADLVASDIYLARYPASSAASHRSFRDLNDVREWANTTGHVPFSVEDLDLIRPYVTLTSDYPGSQTPWLSTGIIESSMIDTTLFPFSGIGDETNGFTTNLPAGAAASIGVGSVVRFHWGGVEPDVYRTVTSVNSLPAATTVSADNGGTIDLVWVDGMTFVGASAGSPGYVKVGGEWVSYIGATVDDVTTPTILTLDCGLGRGEFGTLQADQTGSAVDADVICWENTLTYDPPLDSDEPQLGIDLLALPLVLPEITVQNRHGINVNTVTEPAVLAAVFRDSVHASPIADPSVLVADLLAHAAGGGAPYSYFDGDEDWFDGDGAGFPRDELVTVLRASADLTGDDERIYELTRTFEPLDATLSDATLPLQFNSGTRTGIHSVGMVDSRAGVPMAYVADGRARLPNVPTGDGREFSVIPIPIWFYLRSQEEFLDHISLVGNFSRNVLTNPLHEGLPPADLADDDDYDDLATGIGTLMPAPGELSPLNPYITLLEGLHGGPDFELDPPTKGELAEQGGPITVSTGNTTSQGIRTASQALTYATDYDQAPYDRNIEADSVHGGMEPFAIEMWVRPGVIADQAVAERQFLVDIGDGSDDVSARNQARLYLDRIADQPDYSLMLRLDDGVAGVGFGSRVTVRSCDVTVDPNQDFGLEPGVWHHVAVAVVGTFSGEIAMVIDGIYDENAVYDFEYIDVGGTAVGGTPTEAAFWPLAMTIPNRQYAISSGGGPLPQFSPTIPLDIVTDLPPVGIVTVKTDGILYSYEYESIGGNTLDLVGTVRTTVVHGEGDPVSFVVPVVHTTVHDDPALTLGVGSQIGLWRQVNLSGAGDHRLDSFAIDDEGGILDDAGVGFAVAGVFTGPTPVVTALGPQCAILQVDPAAFPLGGTDGLLEVAPGALNGPGRWMVFDYDRFITAPVGALAGVMPGDAGTDFAVGAAADDSDAFTGELDELRITSLPRALVHPVGWADSDPLNPASGRVQAWHWMNYGGGIGWQPALLDGAYSEYAFVDGLTRALPRTGGYFLVEGQLYSYDSYTAAGDLSGIQQVRPDFEPAGDGSFDGGGHDGLRRIIPLNFITATRLANPFPTATGDIEVVDATLFPPDGYVKIGSEIIGYSSAAPLALLRPANLVAPFASAFPTGAFGTAPAVHAAGDLVRLLPVRHRDRYRREDPLVLGDWDSHVDYSLAQINDNMTMLSFEIPHSGQLRQVWWRLREPLAANQDVVVLVLIDDAPGFPDWNDDPEAGESDALVHTSVDNLWGYSMRNDSLDPLSPWGGFSPEQNLVSPTAWSRVEVRFYFDLGDTTPYRHTYDGANVQRDGREHMVELDSVAVEMVPESVNF